MDVAANPLPELSGTAPLRSVPIWSGVSQLDVTPSLSKSTGRKSQMNIRSIQVRSYAYVCSICTFPAKIMGDVMNSSASGSFGFSYIFTKEGRWMYILHFTFMHLADAFIQSDLHCIQVTVSTFYQLLLSLGIEPMILALLAPCSTSWATGKLYGVFVFFGLESNPLSAHWCTVKTPLEWRNTTWCWKINWSRMTAI